MGYFEALFFTVYIEFNIMVLDDLVISGKHTRRTRVTAVQHGTTMCNSNMITQTQELMFSKPIFASMSRKTPKPEAGKMPKRWFNFPSKIYRAI